MRKFSLAALVNKTATGILRYYNQITESLSQEHPSLFRQGDIFGKLHMEQWRIEGIPDWWAKAAESARTGNSGGCSSQTGLIPDIIMRHVLQVEVIRHKSGCPWVYFLLSKEPPLESIGIWHQLQRWVETAFQNNQVSEATLTLFPLLRLQLSAAYKQKELPQFLNSLIH